MAKSSATLQVIAAVIKHVKDLLFESGWARFAKRNTALLAVFRLSKSKVGWPHASKTQVRWWTRQESQGCQVGACIVHPRCWVCICQDLPQLVVSWFWLRWSFEKSMSRVLSFEGIFELGSAVNGEDKSSSWMWHHWFVLQEEVQHEGVVSLLHAQSPFCLDSIVSFNSW